MFKVGTGVGGFVGAGVGDFVGEGVGKGELAETEPETDDSLRLRPLKNMCDSSNRTNACTLTSLVGNALVGWFVDGLLVVGTDDGTEGVDVEGVLELGTLEDGSEEEGIELLG